VFAAQYWAVRATNFGGVDEWLYIDLSSRGVLGIPYANRPLVLLGTTVASKIWPHDLRSYWLVHGLYLCLAACLTTLLARRILPGQPLLAILAGVFTAAWAPLDALRLDTVLGTGYSGFTMAVMGALVLFVESWHRNRAVLLALGALVGFVAARGVESVIPVLVMAPILVLGSAPEDRRRLGLWSAAWYGVVALEVALALQPMVSGGPSYQTAALGFDPHPIRALERLARLLGMQAAPLVTSAHAELLTPAVPLAAATFLVLGARAAWAEGGRPAPVGSRAAASRALFLGLLLACSAHAGLALSASVKTSSRTQILSAPGFGLGLAGACVVLGSLIPRRWARVGVLALGAWVVAVGTGRTVAMQGEWDRFRGVFPEQRRTLRDLVREAPALKPGTLVVLLGESRAWPVSLTFRHAVTYLYAGQALGLVPEAADFLYPWSFTPEGISISPWPEIRGAWKQRPSQHSWGALVVARVSRSGHLKVLREWPGDILPPLPNGARYAPLERIVEGKPPPPSHRILSDPGKSVD
jgi:hypothetical protein